MHIAFVDANAAAIEAVRAAKQAGHHVTFVESWDPIYPATPENEATLRLADHLVPQVHTMEPGALAAALEKCHEQCPIDVVTTQHEMVAPAVAAAGRRLGLRGTSPGALLTARRKDQVRLALRRAGLACPRFALATSEAQVLAAAGRIGYPVVVKPVSGTDSLLARVAGGPGEARDAWRGFVAGLDLLPPSWRPQFSRGLLVEELLTGRLVSVEIGCRDGEFYPFCVSGRLRWSADEVVELGAYIPAGLPAPQRRECLDYAMAVCRAIGLDLGVFHLEIMLTGSGPVLVEANARVMGGAMPAIYRLATGQDIFTALVRIFAGDPVPLPGSFSGCTGGHKVAARATGRLSETATLAALAAHPGVLKVYGFGEFGTGPGRPVRQGKTVARFLLRAPDHAGLARTATALVHRLEADLGLNLMSGPLTD